ncbi:enoyl-CoA hydratase/isomerase family protein [Spongiibacter tropicus]|uniref:enoyl-CoA hydratase/isomerase family protein n=1 Tax=Spongiibacter tropicus TaxID=454602 RepID=UPI0004B586E8|nr:enoyl-CoA hydratase/isomerase family protein [Spongiibacter tropicus]
MSLAVAVAILAASFSVVDQRMQVDYSLCLQRLALPAGGYLARLTLNAPAKLNAIGPEMAERLLHTLIVLRDDAEAVAVFIDGAGDRGFCGGADVLRMLESALANPGGAAIEAEALLRCEYMAAYLIHTFPKPVICWADGRVRGAGLGLMAGASHRIVTERSQLSVSEASIGLIPTAGASWYLGQMPGHTGLFAALTGVELGPADALYSGLADYCWDSQSKESLLNSLLELSWEEDPEANSELLTDCLTDWEVEQGVSLQDAPLKAHRPWIDKHCERRCVRALKAALERDARRNDWLALALDGANRGAASALKLIVRQFADSRGLGLADVFRLEMVLAANRLRDPEFAEGVRARFKDRDECPNWCYRCVDEVPDEETNALFVPPWDRHPLADLGR